MCQQDRGDDHWSNFLSSVNKMAMLNQLRIQHHIDICLDCQLSDSGMKLGRADPINLQNFEANAVFAR
jgi:hypothetical protein